MSKLFKSAELYASYEFIDVDLEHIDAVVSETVEEILNRMFVEPDIVDAQNVWNVLTLKSSCAGLPVIYYHSALKLSDARQREALLDSDIYIFQQDGRSRTISGMKLTPNGSGEYFEDIQKLIDGDTKN